MTEALKHCWHPVAYGREVGRDPLKVTLLGQNLVLWRSAERINALSDLCIHRGTALSLGQTVDDEIVCPYHGWRFGPDGACTRIPQLADPARIPRKARVPAYGCQERYGLVWVRLDEGEVSRDLPEVPELEDPSWRVVETGPFAWEANASRQLENFTDFGHFPFVHPGLLGDPQRTEVPPHHVETRDNVLHYQIQRPEAPNTQEFPIFANEGNKSPMRTNTYEVYLPYTLVLRIAWPDKSRKMVYLFASQPLSEQRCVGYCLVARNYNLDQPDEVIQDFEEVIFGQDRRIVESQRPREVPFDLVEELHLSFDKVAVAYRRAMRAQGFE